MLILPKKKQKKEIDHLLRLPLGTLGTDSKITLMGNREFCIDGCKGVLEYTTELIRLNLGNRILKLNGRNLCIRVMEQNYVEVEGYFTTLEFI